MQILIWRVAYEVSRRVTTRLRRALSWWAWNAEARAYQGWKKAQTRRGWARSTAMVGVKEEEGEG